MPFTDRAQAHQKANGADRDAVLQDGGYDRRVEESDRLERVIHREIRADQELPGAGWNRLDGYRRRDLLVMLGEDALKVWMLKAGISLEARHQLFHFCLGKRIDAVDDFARSLHVAGIEQPGDDP